LKANDIIEWNYLWGNTMMYLRSLLCWSQRLLHNKKKTLIVAFILCALFETFAGTTQPDYSLPAKTPYFTETLFILFQLCSLISTIYYLSLVELNTINHMSTVQIKNSVMRRVVMVAIPIIVTLITFDIVLFIRGTIVNFVYQIANPSGEAVEYILNSSLDAGCKSITLDNYISRVFQLGDASENNIINVIDHLLRYMEPGLIIFNMYYIFTNPLSQLTEDNWIKEISCNPSLIRKIELNHKRLRVHLQNVFLIKTASAKYKVALVVDKMKYRFQDVLILIILFFLSILSLTIRLKFGNNLVFTIVISFLHPVIYIGLCLSITNLRENSSGNPMIYEISAFSEDYRTMKLNEIGLQCSQITINGYYHSFKNENVTYLVKNSYHSESDNTYKYPVLIMIVFVLINFLIFNTLPSWLYIMPIGIGDILLLNDVLHRSTKPQALGFIKRYLIYSSLIYIVLLCTRFF